MIPCPLRTIHSSVAMLQHLVIDKYKCKRRVVPPACTITRTRRSQSNHRCSVQHETSHQTPLHTNRRTLESASIQVHYTKPEANPKPPGCATQAHRHQVPRIPQAKPQGAGTTKLCSQHKAHSFRCGQYRNAGMNMRIQEVWLQRIKLTTSLSTTHEKYNSTVNEVCSKHSTLKPGKPESMTMRHQTGTTLT